MVADPTKAGSVATTVSKETADRAFTIMSVTDDLEYLNMVIYGPYGSGKTTLAASSADVDEMADVLVLDVESGKMVIKDNDRIEHKERIDVVRITNFTQLAKVHEFLIKHLKYRDDDSAEATKRLIALEAKFKGIPEAKIKKPKRYRTVILDSTSELDALLLYELMGMSTDMNLDEALKDNDVEVADWPIFRKNNQMMQLIIRAYRDLPVNAFFICHAVYTQDERKRMFYAPGMTGKLKDQIQGFVDIVGYLKVGEQVEGKESAPRRLYVQPVGNYAAKNRKASFKESYFDDPVMSEIWDVVSEGGE